MLKQFYLGTIFIFVLIITGRANQSHFYTPSDSLHGNLTATSKYNESDIFIYFHNNTSNKMLVTWKFLSYDAPADWSVGLCDNIACYYNDANNSIYDNHITDTIQPNDSIFLKAVFTPQCKSGTGHIKLYVHINGDAGAPDTLTYKSDIVAACTDGITDINNYPLLNIYPNPVTSDLVVSGLPADNRSYNLEVLDLQGRVLFSANNQAQEKIILNQRTLVPGMYLLKITGLNDHSTVTRTFTKQ